MLGMEEILSNRRQCLQDQEITKSNFQVSNPRQEFYQIVLSLTLWVV